MDEVVPDRILTIDGQPACLSFDPLLPARLAIGTYNLQQNEGGQQKTGAIFLYEVAPDEFSTPWVATQQIDLSAAVFDLLWTTSHGLIVALSDGSLAFFEFDQTQVLKLSRRESIFESSIGITSIAYRPRTSSTTKSLLACTTSTGEVTLLALDEGSSKNDSPDVSLVRRLAFELEPHGQEAWCVYFSEKFPILFSGGDDSVFRALDISEIASLSEEDCESSFEERSPQERTLCKDRKSHGAGVTAIISLPWPALLKTDDSSQLILTGSYDETIRLFQYPSRKLLAEKRLDGGVWRLKVLPQPSTSTLQVPQERHSRTISFESALEDCSFLIAASCMQAGTRILRLSRQSKPNDADGEWSFEVIAMASGMELNYGFDFYRGNTDPWAGGSLKMFSISFYDRILVAWRINEKRRSETANIGIRVQKGSDTSLASRVMSEYEISPEDSVSNDGRKGDELLSFTPSQVRKGRRTPLTPSEHTDDEEVAMQIEPEDMGLL